MILKDELRELAERVGPNFDPAGEAAALDEMDRRYLVAVPRQIPAEAHWIAHSAGDPEGSLRWTLYT